MRAKGGGENGNLNVKVLDKFDYSKVDSGWTIAESGLAVKNDLYEIVYYNVTAGNVNYVKAKDDTNECKFVWSTFNSVSSYNTNQLVGNPITNTIDGLVSVPIGASWLCFSQLKTDTETGLYRVEVSQNKGE